MRENILSVKGNNVHEFLESLKSSSFDTTSLLMNKTVYGMEKDRNYFEHDCHASPEDGCDCQSLLEEKIAFETWTDNA